MTTSTIDGILRRMTGSVDCRQLNILRTVLKEVLHSESNLELSNGKILNLFLQAKQIEGRSPKTLEYYEATIRALVNRLDMLLRQITTAQLREYLSESQQERMSSKLTIDKGTPIEQAQKLLGHARIDTTMHYALVNQNNVKLSPKRYLG